MSLYLIAEVGINHNGSIDIAKSLIEAASKAGFDAVKLQKRTVEKVYTKDFLNSPRESQWGHTQMAQKMGLEFSEAQYDEINEFCDHLGIEWSASAWDVDSQFFLRKYNLKFNKIASPMLGHKSLLREVSSEGLKTYISTGMSTLHEIDEAVNLFVQKKCDFELMHCNSTYPMKEEDANLLCIPMLRERYGVPVGYSGHESSLYKVCAAAVAIGASSIERHITLDRAMYGSDQAASIQTNVLPEFVADLRKIKLILGSGKKEIGEAEMAVREKLRVTHD